VRGGNHHPGEELESVLGEIVDCVNKKRDHIPPVVSEKSLTYPFDIKVVKKASVDINSKASLGLDFVRRVLSSTQPPSVLQ